MPNSSLILVMGVSGSGKSTLGKGLAETLEYTFLDADSYHDEHAITMMRRGLPLTENERAPWMLRITSDLKEKQKLGGGIVLAISGLKKRHRQQLRAVNSCALTFVLNVEKQVLCTRLAQRQSHFFSPLLLDSQLAAQEPAGGEPNTFELDGTENIDMLIARCKKVINEIE